MFGLLTIPAGLILSVGILLHESDYMPDFAYKQVPLGFCLLLITFVFVFKHGFSVSGEPEIY